MLRIGVDLGVERGVELADIRPDGRARCLLTIFSFSSGTVWKTGNVIYRMILNKNLPMLTINNNAGGRIRFANVVDGYARIFAFVFGKYAADVQRCPVFEVIRSDIVRVL